MRPTSITCRRTIQVERFEPETAEITYEVEPGDDPREVYAAARAFVETVLGLRPAEPPAVPTPAPADEETPIPW